MDVAQPVPEDAAIMLFRDASERLASDSTDDRVIGWETIGDLCNGRPQYVEQAWAVVRGQMDRESDALVVEAAVYAVGHMAANDYDHEHVIPEGRELLLASADAVSADVRLAVARELPWVFGGDEDARVVSALIALTHDPEDEVRDWATFGLGRQLIGVDTRDLRAALIDRLTDDHSDTRDEAMIGLARRGDPVVKEIVLDVLASDLVSALAVESAAWLGDDDFLLLLIQLRDWWDAYPELLENAISRSDPSARAAAALQQLRDGVRREFARSSMQLIDVAVDADPGDLDGLLRFEWKDTRREHRSGLLWPRSRP